MVSLISKRSDPVQNNTPPEPSTISSSAPGGVEVPVTSAPCTLIHAHATSLISICLIGFLKTVNVSPVTRECCSNWSGDLRASWHPRLPGEHREHENHGNQAALHSGPSLMNQSSDRPTVPDHVLHPEYQLLSSGRRFKVPSEGSTARNTALSPPSFTVLNTSPWNAALVY